MIWATLLGALLSAAPGRSSARAPASPDSTLVVTTNWLWVHRNDVDVVVLEVDGSDSAYRAGHLPGARLLRYSAVAVDANDLNTELPPADSLRRSLERLGVSTSSHVILTGAALVVTRAFFTLDYFGLHVSVLNGGTAQWQREGHSLTATIPAIVPGHLDVIAHPEAVASAAWIMQHAHKVGMALIDTRREDEYRGTTAASAGHIAGARRLDWESFFRAPADFSLKSTAELQTIMNARVSPGDTVVAYCRVGHRSSATYFVSRLLGLPAKLYDGSYQDWSGRQLPLVRDSTD